MNPSGMTNQRVGNVVDFTCSAQGGPGNMFNWTLDGIEVAVTPNLTRNINSALDGGIYQCRVENDAGFDTAPVTINGTS